jgi:hypothetical protein
MKRVLPILALLVACSQKEVVNVPQECTDLCRELVTECGYEAYPTLDSCLQGCVYRIEEENLDMVEQAECVLDAGCDTFEIIECENEISAR